MNVKTATAPLPAEHPPQEQHRSVLRSMADRYDMEPKAFEATLRATVVPSSASREQFAAFLVVANEYGLNPLTKEIYAFPAKGGGIVPIVGIDGWSNLINSHPAFDGMDFTDSLDTGGNVVSITCEMFRKDRTRSISATEYMAECRRTTEPWQKWPRRMLRHKAMIQAARYAFGFAGIIDNDEYDRFHGEQARDVTPTARRAQSVAQAFDQFSAPAALPPADAAGQTIDHDPATGEAWDFVAAPDPEADAPPATEKSAEKPKPAAEQKPPAKPKADTKPPARAKPADAPPAVDPKPPAEPQGSPQSDDPGPGPDAPPADNGAAGAQAGEDDAAFDAGIDQDARDWPPGQVPTEYDEYDQYVDTQMKNATDPKALQTAFVADAALRKDCGVTTEQYTAFVDKIKRRMEALRSASR